MSESGPGNYCGGGYKDCPTEQRIADLEAQLAAVTKWDDPIEYLYDQKPEECLYRRGDEDDRFGGLTFKHADHLTRENLRGKWEIARELAYRDALLQEAGALLRKAKGIHCPPTKDFCGRRDVLLAKIGGGE